MIIENCKHCNREFEQRRSNHKYCKKGCKTMASYKRNGYKYISGRYQKDDSKIESKKDSTSINEKKIMKKLKSIEREVKNQHKDGENGVLQTMKGVAAYDLAKYVAKSVLDANDNPFKSTEINNLIEQNRVLIEQNKELMERLKNREKIDITF